MKSALIIDDHPLFCDALSMTVRTVVGVSDVTTAGSLSEALDALNEGDGFDVVLLDLNLPDVSGLDGVLRVRRSAGTTPIVVVSSFSDPRMVRATIDAGAQAFVPKHSARDVFRAAFSAVADGQTYMPDADDSLEGITSDADRRKDALERMAQLTQQQAKILSLICDGMLNKQIAYELSIAEATVKAHVTAIMRKLGVQSRTQAVLIAQEANFANVLHGNAEQA